MLAYIVSHQEDIALTIRKLLVKEGLDCPADNIVRLDSASDRLSGEKPDLVVMVLGSEPTHALDVMSGLRVAPARVLAVGPASDAKMLIRASLGCGRLSRHERS